MKKENGFYIDENNNRWNCYFFTEDQAIKNSESLTRCSDCSDCSDCSGYKTNPQRFVSSRLGSRNSQTTAYWTSKEDVQIVCGCFRGDLGKFEKQVKETHANTSHLEPYLKLIEVIKYCVNSEI